MPARHSTQAEPPSPERREETALVRQAQAGDQDAFGALVRRYTRRVYALSYRMLRHKEEAEDMVQETFIRAYRALDRFDARRPFSNWLLTIAARANLNALRARERRGSPVSLDGGPAERETALSERLPGNAPSPGERLALNEELERALGQLPPRMAMLMELHYREEMPIAEAAKVMGMKTGAAKVALHRARARLREWISEQEDRP